MDTIDIFLELSLSVKRNFSHLLDYAKSEKLNAIVIQENSGSRADCTTSAVLIDGIVFTSGGLIPFNSNLCWRYGSGLGGHFIMTDDILFIQEIMSIAFSRLKNKIKIPCQYPNKSITK